MSTLQFTMADFNAWQGVAGRVRIKIFSRFTDNRRQTVARQGRYQLGHTSCITISQRKIIRLCN